MTLQVDYCRLWAVWGSCWSVLEFASMSIWKNVDCKTDSRCGCLLTLSTACRLFSCCVLLLMCCLLLLLVGRFVVSLLIVECFLAGVYLVDSLSHVLVCVFAVCLKVLAGSCCWGARWRSILQVGGMWLGMFYCHRCLLLHSIVLCNCRSSLLICCWFLLVVAEIACYCYLLGDCMLHSAWSHGVALQLHIFARLLLTAMHFVALQNL